MLTLSKQLLWVLGVLASYGIEHAESAKAPSIQRDYPVAQITERVYVLYGPMAFPDKDNQGFMNNPAFVLTDGGVVVIDPGSSVQIGEMVLRRISKTTTAPVVAVFNTHIHGDHWLGNQAIKEAYPRAKIYAHPRMIKKLNGGDGQAWVDRLHQSTDGATAGTRAVLPDHPVIQGDVVRIGGLDFRIHHYGKAHSDNDILVEVARESVVFMGDTVVNEILTRMDDTDIKGQIETVQQALALKAKHYIPGHGQSGGPEIAKNYLTFLQTLHASVKKYYEKAMSDYEMKPKIVTELRTYKGWKRFDDVIGKSISVVYLQVEADAF